MLFAAWEVPMILLFPVRPVRFSTEGIRRLIEFRRMASGCALAGLLLGGAASAQIVVNSKTGTITNSSTGKAAAQVDVRYQQIKPTHVPLAKSELDTKTRLELIRVLQSEQGFAMRPFPGGHKGLTLEANGYIDPAGEPYLDMVTANGL